MEVMICALATKERLHYLDHFNGAVLCSDMGGNAASSGFSISLL